MQIIKNKKGKSHYNDQTVQFCIYFKFLMLRVFCDIFEIYSDENKQVSQTDYQLTDLFTYFGNEKSLFSASICNKLINVVLETYLFKITFFLN